MIEILTATKPADTYRRRTCTVGRVDTKKRRPAQRPTTHFEQIPVAAIKVADTRDNMLEKKIAQPPARLIQPPRTRGQRGEP
jgi:hypothetical protein